MCDFFFLAKTDAASSFLPYLFTQALEKMGKEWSTVVIDVLPYKNTGTYILTSPDEVSQLLDDHIVMTQSMSLSPFKKTFEARINSWESKLRMTQVHNIDTYQLWKSCDLCFSCCAAALFWYIQDVLEEWLMCQRSWLYLEPIFSSDDINQQLPTEGKRYQQMEQNWRSIMKSAFNNRKVRERLRVLCGTREYWWFTSCCGLYMIVFVNVSR